jgi:dipeptidyl aminopeptidase/acylaminoacyl peptidase
MTAETVKAVAFENEGQTIRGAVHLPAGAAGRCPAVLMCHGLTGQRIEAHRLFVKASRALAAAGIASLRFDFLGSGESDGDFRQMTVTGELADALVAADYLARRRRVDRGRLGILGLSLGGMVTALVLGRTARFKSAALWSAAARMRWTDVLTPAQVRRWRQRGYLNLGGMCLGAGFLGDLARHDPLADIARSTADVLIVHGTEDASVPVGQAREYERALRRRPRRPDGTAPRVSAFLVRDADHTYARPDWERAVIERAVRWFRRTL